MKKNVCCGILKEIECNYNLSMENNKAKENIHKIFENWNEMIIWSCLQGDNGWEIAAMEKDKDPIADIIIFLRNGIGRNL